MKKFDLNLAESELKLVLEALTDMDAKMANICEASNDEDEVAEVGNDLIELRLFLKPLIKKAEEKYGQGVTNFSRELL